MPYGLASSRIWRNRLSLVSLLLAGSLLAAPSPLDDEEFLIFLADSIEKDGELIDPLSMIEESNENDHEQWDSKIKEEEASDDEFK